MLILWGQGCQQHQGHLLFRKSHPDSMRIILGVVDPLPPFTFNSKRDREFCQVFIISLKVSKSLRIGWTADRKSGILNNSLSLLKQCCRDIVPKRDLAPIDRDLASLETSLETCNVSTNDTVVLSNANWYNRKVGRLEDWKCSLPSFQPCRFPAPQSVK